MHTEASSGWGVIESSKQLIFGPLPKKEHLIFLISIIPSLVSLSILGKLLLLDCLVAIAVLDIFFLVLPRA
jgi:hypothetical protein